MQEISWCGMVRLRDLTSEDMANRLQVHIDTVRRWARENRIQYYRLPGGSYRFPPEALEQVRAQSGEREVTR